MTNQQIADAVNDIYRVFWIKWRGMALLRKSPEWDSLTGEAKELIKKHPFPLAQDFINNLMDELESRCYARDVASKKEETK